MQRFDSKPDAPITAKVVDRFLSRGLKWLGFRYGAPLFRATATFTLEDLKQALFGNDDHDVDVHRLTFTTVIERLTIKMRVTGVREYEVHQDPDLRNNLFDGVREDSCWIVEGLLMHWGNVAGDEQDVIATSYAFEQRDDPPEDRQEEEDAYLKVLAVVAFRDGQFASAIVQCLPSPCDQLLYLPPL